MYPYSIQNYPVFQISPCCELLCVQNSLVPRPFHINCVGGEKGPGTHCFADVTLWYDFLQNIREALYVPSLLVRCTPKALHCHVLVKGVLPGRLSLLLLVPFAEGDSLLLLVCQNCPAKLNPSKASCTNSMNLLKTASASSTYKEARVPKTLLV